MAESNGYYRRVESPRNIYTPSELNREARLHLEAGFPRVCVEGEVSNLSRPASGHLYFSLKDEQAQIRCALFRSDAARLSFAPADGLQVLARGRLSLYEPRGTYQLIADSLEEAGAGRLQAAFEALKRKLEQEGLFDPGRKQALPAYPRRIAVITSPSGAVIRDILQVLARRWPLAAVRLYPVPVQGTEAPGAIAAALASANRHGWGEAIILGRGGGSLEDLWAFNEERVARAVFDSQIPVISAVGHETDYSISDFVADQRAPTPSAAAELLAPDGDALRQRFRALETQLSRRVQGRLQQLAQRHDHLVHRLRRQHPGYRLEQHRKTLHQCLARVRAAGARLLPQRRTALAGLDSRLGVAGRRLVPERRSRLQDLARTLHAVSPLPTLDRGYAILSGPDGRVIGAVAQASVGQPITAQLHDGRLYGTVERITAEGLRAGEEEDPAAD